MPNGCILRFYFTCKVSVTGLPAAVSQMLADDMRLLDQRFLAIIGRVSSFSWTGCLSLVSHRAMEPLITTHSTLLMSKESAFSKPKSFMISCKQPSLCFKWIHYLCHPRLFTIQTSLIRYSWGRAAQNSMENCLAQFYNTLYTHLYPIMSCWYKFISGRLQNRTHSNWKWPLPWDWQFVKIWWLALTFQDEGHL